MKWYPKEILSSKTFWTAVVSEASLVVAFAFGSITVQEFIAGSVLAFQSINLKSGQITEAQ